MHPSKPRTQHTYDGGTHTQTYTRIKTHRACDECLRQKQQLGPPVARVICVYASVLCTRHIALHDDDDDDGAHVCAIYGRLGRCGRTFFNGVRKCRLRGNVVRPTDRTNEIRNGGGVVKLLNVSVHRRRTAARTTAKITLHFLIRFGSGVCFLYLGSARSSRVRGPPVRRAQTSLGRLAAPVLRCEWPGNEDRTATAATATELTRGSCAHFFVANLSIPFARNCLASRTRFCFFHVLI